MEKNPEIDKTKMKKILLPNVAQRIASKIVDLEADVVVQIYKNFLESI